MHTGEDQAEPATAHPRPRRTTLAQVAERADVSLATASFVLTGRTDQRITEETQIRVRAAADDLGYRPNAAAKTLRTGKSGTIAFVSEYVASTPYATRSIAGALQAALKHDTLMFVAETLGEPDIERRLLHSMMDRRVDGFVYAAMFTREVSVPELIRDAPLVLLNCVSPDVDAPMVVPNDVAAGRTAAGVLLQAGHRDGIYYLGVAPRSFRGGPQWAGRLGLAIADRPRGVRAELKSANATLAGAIPLADWEPEYGRAAVHELLASGRVPRALICANDRVALGAYQALQSAALRIPQDVSVVSFDDSDLANGLQPGLSSVALPHEEMGRLAADLLLSGDGRAGRHLVPMPLSLRDSIAPPSEA